MDYYRLDPHGKEITVLTVDPSNPVIAAVARGTAAELARDFEAAREAYEDAWRTASDDFERCVAAHYLPRLIDDPVEKLRWNEDALRFADALGDDRVTSFYPSLWANVARCRLDLGDYDGARLAFNAATQHLDALPDDAQREGLVAMINDGLAELRLPSESGPSA